MGTDPLFIRPRYVLVELTTEDWRDTDPATYVKRSMPGFMGTVRTKEVEDLDNAWGWFGDA